MADSAEPAAPMTAGAHRAQPGEYFFELAKVNHLAIGPDYSTANGAVVEGETIIAALMNFPAGTGAERHSHPNEQWLFILDGEMDVEVEDQKFTAKAGGLIYFPPNVVHKATASAAGDCNFFTMKDKRWHLHGIKAD